MRFPLTEWLAEKSGQFPGLFPLKLACDSTCAEGSTFGRERFAFVAERVLDARFLGGILSLNSNKINVKCGDGDTI